MIGSLFPEEIVAVQATAQMACEPLHSQEAASTGRMSPDRLREFALGRACARRALASLGLADAPVLRGPDRAPVWPDGVIGSITHCDGFCGVAVATRGAILSVGLDAELAAPLSAGALRRICTPDDLAHLAELPGLDALPGLPHPGWGKLIFSAKESFYKCYFPLTHTRLGFRDAQVRLDLERQRFEVRLIRPDAPDAAGRRVFAGRFALRAPHVFTAVTLPASSDLDY